LGHVCYPLAPYPLRFKPYYALQLPLKVQLIGLKIFEQD
jgi:hypothetical protein